MSRGSSPGQNLRVARCRQRGVAVVTALLLTTLAVTIVASVFWQQQVQVRAVENQRLQSQTQWVMRAALDWTRIILREDARTTAVDQLGESWAVPLPETRLDDYIGNGSGGEQEVSGTLSGYVIDAQSRYNLTNLSQGGTVNPQELIIFRRLLGFLSINPSLADATATAISATQMPTDTAPLTPQEQTGLKANGNPGLATISKSSAANSHNQQARLIHNEDLITVPGYTPAIIEKLKNYVVILPIPTAVNVNTAGREVLAAKANFSLEQASALIASRTRSYFVNIQDFRNRAQSNAALSEQDLSVKTNFFLVFDKVHWDRANLNMEALVYRKNSGNTTVSWLRD